MSDLSTDWMWQCEWRSNLDGAPGRVGEEVQRADVAVLDVEAEQEVQLSNVDLFAHQKQLENKGSIKNKKKNSLVADVSPHTHMSVQSLQTYVHTWKANCAVKVSLSLSNRPLLM